MVMPAEKTLPASQKNPFRGQEIPKNSAAKLTPRRVNPTGKAAKKTLQRPVPARKTLHLPKKPFTCQTNPFRIPAAWSGSAENTLPAGKNPLASQNNPQPVVDCIAVVTCVVWYVELVRLQVVVVEASGGWGWW